MANAYRVIDRDDANRIATVSVGEGLSVDVKCFSGWMYVMQNSDGTEVYETKDRERTVPGYRFDTDLVFSAVEELYSNEWKNWED